MQAPSGSWPAEPPRLRLAHLPTPVEPLWRPSQNARGPQVDIKRDDLTGSILSGNKVRKLEFVLAEALAQRATCVITCGGIQSNHARATAGAAARVGLRPILLLQGHKPHSIAGREPCGADGNLFLDQLLGAQIHWLTPAQYEERDRLMAETAAELRAAGERPFVIPEGASNEIGAWGYAAMVGELAAQRPDLPWTHIVCAIGSGGTHAGLLIGSRLAGWNVRVRSYLVHRDPDYFRGQVMSILEAFMRRYAVRLDVREDDIDIVAGYAGPAYAQPYPQEIAVIRRLASEAGIVLDPVYTGKAMAGLLDEIERGRYSRDDRILFVHTGGIFGLLAQREHFAAT